MNNENLTNDKSFYVCLNEPLGRCSGGGGRNEEHGTERFYPNASRGIKGFKLNCQVEWNLISPVY